jgi:hypothetical protein
VKSVNDSDAKKIPGFVKAMTVEGGFFPMA